MALCYEAFEAEKIPVGWAEGLICPLFKGGDRRCTRNYRGITLLSVVGKLFTAILNKRLSSWCEHNKVLVDEQAGFRKDRSTIDQLFVLTEVIHSRREKKQDTFCAFLDIRKAYDTLFRDAVWCRLLEVGVKGKFWRVIVGDKARNGLHYGVGYDRVVRFRRRCL